MDAVDDGEKQTFCQGCIPCICCKTNESDMDLFVSPNAVVTPEKGPVMLWAAERHPTVSLM